MSDGLGVEVDLSAHIAAAVGHAVGEAFASERRSQQQRDAAMNGLIMPLNIDPIPVPVSGGAGTLDVPRLLGPPMGWTWQLEAIGAQGFTAGSVAAFLNSSLPGGVLLNNFAAAGELYHGRLRRMRYGERLIFTATGITGAPVVWISGIAYADAIQWRVLI